VGRLWTMRLSFLKISIDMSIRGIPQDASYVGAKESAGPSLQLRSPASWSLSLWLCQRGAALLFVQMAYTVGFSLMASLFGSLTVVPVLTSKFIKSKEEREKKKSPSQGRFTRERSRSSRRSTRTTKGSSSGLSPIEKQ